MAGEQPKYVNKANLTHFWNNIQGQIGSASQEQVDAWLDAHPEATTTVQDGSVTDPKLVQTGGVLSKIGAYALTSDDCDFGFSLGSLDSGVTTSNQQRIVSALLPCRENDIYQCIDSDYLMSLHMYDSDGVWQGSIAGSWQSQKIANADGYARVIMRKVSNADIDASEIPAIASTLRVYSGALLTGYTNHVYKQNAIITTRWSNRIWSGQNNVWSINYTRIGMQERVVAPYDIKVTADSGYKVSALVFSSLDAATTDSIMGWGSEQVIPSGSIFLLNFARADDVKIRPDESIHITFTKADPQELATGHVTSADFIKRAVSTTLLGGVSGNQAFCKYNGKYYSTNGSQVFLQDSSFNLESTVSLALGHGNSFQLGSAGTAYASGWDDNRVYAVNLSTLAIVDTYTLPTSGYTTVAVDDVSGIMYIFQRDSYPDTVATYNFIAYDYANQQTLSTRKVKAFAAMQACDYYDGRIIVAYGTGTSTAPSGMFVCNTAGDVLVEYDLSIFASTEPEGVCYDRETGELLLSLVNGNVYRIESV